MRKSVTRKIVKVFNRLKEELRLNFNEAGTKAEIDLDQVKNKLSNIIVAEQVGRNLAKRVINTFSIWKKETTGVKA